MQKKVAKFADHTNDSAREPLSQCTKLACICALFKVYIGERACQSRCADKSLARPGRKQARKHVRYERDFNNIETRAVIKFFILQGKAPKEIHTILTEILACLLRGRAKDLSAPLFRGQVKRIMLPEQDDHDRKIRSKKQSTDIGKYCFANTTIKLWNRLTAEVLAAGRCKSHVFRKRVREVIVIEEKK